MTQTANESSPAPNQERLFRTLQRLLDIPATDIKTTLTSVADTIAEALNADKVDAFLYDDSRDSLVAVGTSTQPLSRLERELGLDVLPLSNGGRAVHVYKTGLSFHTGNLLDDADEVRGIKEGLQIQSKIGVALEIGGLRRGLLMVASQKADFFSTQDVRFCESVARWIGIVAHRSELLQEIAQNALEEGRHSAAEELIAVLAHDLRNHLSPAVLRLYSLKHRAEVENRHSDLEDIRVALKNLSSLNVLLSNLLDVTRLDEGVFQSRIQPVAMVDLVRDAAGAMSTPEHQIEVRASEPLIVAADPVRIRQCIDNLLSNAVGHSPKGGTVTVLMQTEHKDGSGWSVIEVIDEGPGVPEDLLPHIFDRFLTGRSHEGGIGLGLYIAKRIAAAHQGDLSADRFPGKGARFTLRLPLLTLTSAQK